MFDRSPPAHLQFLWPFALVWVANHVTSNSNALHVNDMAAASAGLVKLRSVDPLLNLKALGGLSWKCIANALGRG